jgi:chromosomal replication initiator protein
MDQYTFDDHPDQIRLRQAWDHVQRRVAAEIPAMWFERFLKPLKAGTLHDGKVTLIAPGKFVLEWVQQKYAGQLERMLGDELGEEVVLDLQSAPREREMSDDLPTTTVSVAARTPVSSPQRFIPNPKYVFEGFVVGQSNRLAYAGARNVAEKPGTIYNPLFIYGASGLGKTHLLHAIAHEILKRDPNHHVAYVTAQQFTEEFVSALQNGRVEQFRRAQRNVGIWLLDDVQFIANKDKTQEEVFHTFNYLHSLDKQIVLISDRPPRDLSFMDERLRSRFECGLVADIHPPDTETRWAILRTKAQLANLELDDDVALYLAENVPGNVRILEGALTRLVAQASVSEQPLNLEVAKQLIEFHYRKAGFAKPSFNQIVHAVSRQFEIPVDEIRGTRRQANIVQARHVAIYITREMTGDSWKHIGTLFGDRDHTSMMHGYHKISELINSDKELKQNVKLIMRSLQPE